MVIDQEAFERLSEARNAVKAAEADVEEKKESLKASKEALDACLDALNDTVDDVIDAKRQPSLFQGASAPVEDMAKFAEDVRASVKSSKGNFDGLVGTYPEGSDGSDGEWVEECPMTRIWENVIVEEQQAGDAGRSRGFDDKTIQQMQEQIAEFKDFIDDVPQWGKWSEFDVSVYENTVRVLYIPDWKCQELTDRFCLQANGSEETEFFEDFSARGRPKQMSLMSWTKEKLAAMLKKPAKRRKQAVAADPATVPSATTISASDVGSLDDL